MTGVIGIVYSDVDQTDIRYYYIHIFLEDNLAHIILYFIAVLMFKLGHHNIPPVSRIKLYNIIKRESEVKLV